MKRHISDLLDSYLDKSIALDENAPLSAPRIKELTMRKIAQTCPPKPSGQEGQGRVRKPFSRGLLLAAVITLLCCLTAFAITISLHESARMNMGIAAETPIPEWTEYAPPKEAGAKTDADHAVLLATMCSGEQLYAYFEVSPIPAEIAAILADNASPQYEWDLSGIQAPGGCTFHVEQTDYDPETQTALVKVYVRGEGLKQLQQIELRLAITHNLKNETLYDPVVIPVTSSQMISCPADIAVKNTKAHFEAAWGLRPEMPTLSDYLSEGRIHRISICAGYIEVELKAPTLEQWMAESGVDQLEFEVSPEMVVAPGMENWYLRRMFSGNWHVSIAEVLQGASLHYKDGTQERIDELPRAYAGAWSPTKDSLKFAEEGTQVYQFIPKQALDLSSIASITICDTEYPLTAIEEGNP